MTTDRELDRMYEAAVAQDWEEQNAGNTPEWESAIKAIRIAGNLLTEANAKLTEAAKLVKWSAERYRIESLADEISWMAKDIAKQMERMKR